MFCCKNLQTSFLACAPPTYLLVVKGTDIGPRAGGPAASVLHGQRSLSKNRKAGFTSSPPDKQLSSDISMGSGNDDGAGPSPDEQHSEDDEGDSAENAPRSRTTMTEDQPNAQHETWPKAECIFGIIAPGFCLESISVNLQTPSTVHAVTHAAQTVREVCSGIPLLQPCGGWGLFLGHQFGDITV